MGSLKGLPHVTYWMMRPREARVPICSYIIEGLVLVVGLVIRLSYRRLSLWQKMLIEVKEKDRTWLEVGSLSPPGLGPLVAFWDLEAPRPQAHRAQALLMGLRVPSPPLLSGHFQASKTPGRCNMKEVLS